MKIPKSLLPLIEDGIVDNVVSQLMSGKEATVYVVQCGDELRCAKVYKEVHKRSFKNAAQYQEGRKVRNSRRARAMSKGSKFGKSEQESAWKNTEVDALYKLHAAGVRVPAPYGCFNGVLIMDLILDEDGNVAPRLNDVGMSADQAHEDYLEMIGHVQNMLCCGLIHGDLSEFNVLVDAYGPVIIDLPQVVDASANNNAQRMLMRDIRNMTNYYAQFCPSIVNYKFGQEMWALFEKGELTPDVDLSGQFKEDTNNANVTEVLQEIIAAQLQEEEKRARINGDVEEY
mgnify:CR=1 FL=1